MANTLLQNPSFDEPSYNYWAFNEAVENARQEDKATIAKLEAENERLEAHNQRL